MELIMLPEKEFLNEQNLNEKNQLEKLQEKMSE